MRSVKVATKLVLKIFELSIIFNVLRRGVKYGLAIKNFCLNDIGDFYRSMHTAAFDRNALFAGVRVVRRMLWLLFCRIPKCIGIAKAFDECVLIDCPYFFFQKSADFSIVVADCYVHSVLLSLSLIAYRIQS